MSFNAPSHVPACTRYTITIAAGAETAEHTVGVNSLGIPCLQVAHWHLETVRKVIADNRRILTVEGPGFP